MDSPRTSRCVDRGDAYETANNAQVLCVEVWEADIAHEDRASDFSETMDDWRPPSSFVLLSVCLCCLAFVSHCGSYNLRPGLEDWHARFLQ